MWSYGHKLIYTIGDFSLKSFKGKQFFCVLFEWIRITPNGHNVKAIYPIAFLDTGAI